MTHTIPTEQGTPPIESPRPARAVTPAKGLSALAAVAVVAGAITVVVTHKSPEKVRDFGRGPAYCQGPVPIAPLTDADANVILSRHQSDPPSTLNLTENVVPGGITNLRVVVPKDGTTSQQALTPEVSGQAKTSKPTADAWYYMIIGSTPGGQKVAFTVGQKADTGEIVPAGKYDVWVRGDESDKACGSTPTKAQTLTYKLGVLEILAG